MALARTVPHIRGPLAKHLSLIQTCTDQSHSPQLSSGVLSRVLLATAPVTQLAKTLRTHLQAEQSLVPPEAQRHTVCGCHLGTQPSPRCRRGFEVEAGEGQWSRDWGKRELQAAGRARGGMRSLGGGTATGMGKERISVPVGMQGQGKGQTGQLGSKE